MVGLIILDGFGHAPPGPGNAISLADTPHWDQLWDSCPHTLLLAHGQAVGLPQGVMGNSEVGHLNLGAGRVVYQPLVLINRALASGEFAANPALTAAMEGAQARGLIHLMGLVSDGGVHSHLDHLLALIKLAAAHKVRPLVHAFLDGRDTPPRSALPFLQQVEAALEPAGGQIATLHGRYYAMDRDHRWERVQRAYRALLGRADHRAPDAAQGLQAAYARGENDEFVQPTLLCPEGQPPPPLTSGDSALFFNFRADRARQLSAALALKDFEGFDREGGPLVNLTTLMEYDSTYGLPHAFVKDQPALTLGELVAQAGLRQFRCAETEKYAHVTYFLNGGREAPFPGEERLLVPSPKVATYDLQPEMSAPAVTHAAAQALASGRFALVVVNFANTDMVGHSGKLEPTIAAVEVVDRGLGQLLEVVRARREPCLVTSDHGNADCILTADGQPHTYHTLNPVPCVFVAPATPWSSHGLLQPSADYQPKLADVAPTLLELMGLARPSQMTGRSLLRAHGD